MAAIAYTSLIATKIMVPPARPQLVARQRLFEMMEDADQDTVVLVLDDYHNVSGSDIDAALAFLIDRMPENLRVIVSTREQLKIPLARWRSLQRVVEMESDDLRFSYDEAVLFFRQTMGLSIDSRSARA